ncbi:LamG domain-containing protein [Chitinophaga silvatica]|uniref:LamG domain-containing protein n=1 Tax=Chitinophaga silvatica TaxID=2282649 RepID=A0A3E1YEE3_9BACT|nr:LamG domain-containing protein [Chitinophaga silvatica]RFS24878.1 LamG domain-containing protein [Chitinophaga silvatica]
MLLPKTLGKLSLISAIILSMFACERTEPISINKPIDEPSNLLTDSLIAYWPLDSSALATDATGKGHNGTSFNTTLTTDRFGRTKGAYYFNGTNSYISVEDQADIRLTNTSYTLSAWVKLENYNTSSGSDILAKRNDLPVGIGLSINGQISSPTGAVFMGAGGGSVNAHGTKVVTLNSWHMVSCTYNYTTQQVRIYVDGILDTVSDGVPPANAPTSKLFIGRDDPAMPTNGYFWQGALDDIRIYKKALTATEILALYQQTAAPIPGLIAHWPLDSSALANDITGNGHTGTSYNTSLTADRFGRTKGAYYFNGTNSYISVEDQADIRLTNTSYTLSAWVKMENYNASSGSDILAKRNDLPVGIGLSINGQISAPTGAVFMGAGGGSVNAHGTKVVALNSWHMVSCTYNYASQQVTIYVDGVLDTVSNGVPPANAPTTKLFIGRDDPAMPTNGYFWQGTLDDIRIYNRALTATEIQQLYSALN